MLIKQTESYQPITITLQSSEEAHTFWGIMERANGDTNAKQLAHKLCSFFSNEAHLWILAKKKSFHQLQSN